MPAQELRYRFQTAILWEAQGFDAYGQATVSSTPTILAPPNGVRWDPSEEGEALDPHGNTVKIAATVVVGQDIAVGSVMWLGTFAELGSLSSIPTSRIMQVIKLDTTKDIRGRATHRLVTLMRLKDDAFPTRV